MQCPYCGFENSEEQVVCVRCSLPLRADVTDPSGTRILDSGSDVASHPRWGTARLGTERKLLLHVRGNEKPLVVNLSDSLVLGRYDTETGDSPDIDLEDYGAQDLGVSRRHATIFVEDDAVKVVDLGSANATFMNGQKLLANQPRILRDGDELRLARLIIRIHFA